MISFFFKKKYDHFLTKKKAISFFKTQKSHHKFPKKQKTNTVHFIFVVVR